MLYTRQSNQLQLLAEDFVLGFAQRTQTQPALSKHQVIVQSTGMATWLSYQLAEHYGISAGVQFSLPAALLWQLTQALIPDAEEAYERQNMGWRLFRLLGDESLPLWQMQGSERLRALLAQNQETGDKKRFLLAMQVADLFDQYLIYRPDWMLDWRSGKVEGAGPQSIRAAEYEPWQPLLWQALVNDCKQAPDRALLQQQVEERLHQDDSLGAHIRENFGSALTVFGLSAMPPPQLALLLAMQKHLDIDIYVCNPCQEYWADIVSPKYHARLAAKDAVRQTETPIHAYYETGHPLLSTAGWAGRDFIDLLLEFGGPADHQENFRVSDNPNLLGQLQKNILQLERPDPTNKSLLQAKDDSICFASCYGPMREVEALHDWLLANFSAEPNLQPKDIVVMVPDIDKYALYIETVFGGARDKLRIPYNLCDHSHDGDTSAASALASLMQLPVSRLAAPEICDLVGTPAIQRRFGLTEADRLRILYLIEQAAIRWGQDADHWKAMGATAAKGEDAYPHSWSFGLQRIMASYALGEKSASLFRQLPPIAGLHQEPDLALTQLLRLMALIKKYRQLLQGPHLAERWASILQDLVADFFDLDASEHKMLSGWYRSLAKLANLKNESGLDEPLTREVITDAMAPDQHRARSSYRFLNGHLTFCTLMPMRNIPFRMVALLGMGEKDFPRGRATSDFNLLESFRRKGDRSGRGEELYMFLEAVLAAQDKLYISWVGRDSRSNQPLPPSTVVTLLKSAIDQGYQFAEKETASEQLSREHPLQPFNRQYRPDNAPWVTYSSLWTVEPTAVDSAEPAQPEKPSLLAVVPLNDLVSFFREPARYFLRSRYNIHPPAERPGLVDHEPFTLQGLEGYSFKSNALKFLRAGKDLNDWRKISWLSGNLPFGQIGEAYALSTERLMQGYQELAGAAFKQDGQRRPIDLDLDGYRLLGEVPDCLENERLVLRVGKGRGKDAISLWLYHLALCASEQPLESRLIDENSVSNNKPTFHLQPMAASEANRLLKEYRMIMANYLQSPVPLTVDSGAIWGKDYIKNENSGSALSKAQAEWHPSAFSSFSEGANWCNQKVWGDFPGSLNADDFEAIAKTVWLSFYEALQTATQTKKLANHA